MDIYAFGGMPNGIRFALTLCMPRAISYFPHFLPLESRGTIVEYLAFPILSAVQALHNAGFYHRDIKPDNVLLTHRGVPKLIDFGLAASIKEKVSPRGTWMYMAPELFIEGSFTSLESEAYGSGVTIGCMVRDIYRFSQIFGKYADKEVVQAYNEIYASPEKIKIRMEEEFDARASHYFCLDLVKVEELKLLVESLIKFDPAKRSSFSSILENQRSKEILTFWETGSCDNLELRYDMFVARKNLFLAMKKSRYGKKQPLEFY